MPSTRLLLRLWRKLETTLSGYTCKVQPPKFAKYCRFYARSGCWVCFGCLYNVLEHTKLEHTGSASR